MTQGGWKSSAICALIVVAAFALCVPLALKSPLKGDFWAIRPDYGPSPSAEDGPSQSKDAIRDPAYLPGEIAAIAGSYVLTLVIVCIAILTIGRRLRRATQASPGTLAMEILKPIPLNQPSTDNPWGPSPISPAKTSLKWPSPKPPQGGWGSLSKHRYQESVRSVATFDESVLEEDKARNEIEMDRLYAAVAAHDEERTRVSGGSSVPSIPQSPLAQHPPELQHLRHGAVPVPPTPTSPAAMRIPIHPPLTSPDLPPLPPSRGSTKSPGGRRLHKPAHLPLADPPSRTSSRASSMVSRKKSASIRDLPISYPIVSPDWETDPSAQPAAFDSVPLDQSGRRFHFASSVHSVRSPTSSRGQSPGPTPRTATFPRDEPTPRNFSRGPSPSQTPRSATFSEYDRATPRSAAFAEHGPRSAAFPVSPPPAIREQPSQEHAGHAYHGFNFQLDAASTHSASPPPSVRSGRSGRAKPTPLPLHGPGAYAPESSQTTLPLRTQDGSQSTLPLRSAIYGPETSQTLPLRSAPLPLRALRSPYAQRPPSMIKATEVERPVKPTRRGLAPVTPGGTNLLSPGTAVPATPYSPYMPMTPLTPMTPSRLITREERRRMKREEGRRVLTKEDMVPEESEMWGDGY